MAGIHANGIDIEYEISGPKDGAPILLIHGFGQQLIAWPDEFVDGLAQAGLRVIRFDNRDTGLTQKWDGQIPDLGAVMAAARERRKPNVPYFLKDMAADAAGLLDALGIASAHILGASMGGMIAQLVALDHPRKTRSLIQIFTTTNDAGLPPSSAEAHQSLITPPSANDRATVIAHVLKSRRAYASTAFAADDEQAAELIGRAYDRCFYPEGGLRQWAAILASPPRGKRLKGLKLPALVLHGTADTLLPCAHGRHIADCIQGAEYHEIEGWGHDLPPSVIPLLLGFILPFVERVEAASTTIRHGRA
ncbi:MAG TPA: alpha/beta hydrolase [Rhizomicrobium sp.]